MTEDDENMNDNDQNKLTINSQHSEILANNFRSNDTMICFDQQLTQSVVTFLTALNIVIFELKKHIMKENSISIMILYNWAHLNSQSDFKFSQDDLIKI